MNRIVAYPARGSVRSSKQGDKSMPGKEWIVCVGLLVWGLVSPALGQLAPPREAPRPEPPTQLPDATPPQVQVGDPEQGRPPPPASPRAFEFEKIYEVDAQGNPISPARWPDLLALTRNPRLSADQRPAIEAAVRQWLAGVERLVLENPDLLMEVAQGLFEKIDPQEPGVLSHAAEVMRALGTTGNLTAYLSTSGVLSNEQAEANRTIVQDFAQARSEAVTREIQALPQEEQQERTQLMMARTTMISLSEDGLRMFRSVSHRGAPHARAALEKAGLEPSAYAVELTALGRATTETEATEAMVALMSKIEPRRLFAFFGALGPMLPAIELPEIAEIGSARGGG